MTGWNKCPNCGITVGGNHDYCPNCGEPWTIQCPNCSRTWRFWEFFKFCDKCGVPAEKLGLERGRSKNKQCSRSMSKE